MRDASVFGESCTEIAAELASFKVEWGDGSTAVVSGRAAESGPLMRALGRAVAAEVTSEAMAGVLTRTWDQRRADAFVALVEQFTAAAQHADGETGPISTT
jgi:hypothetical protein